MQGSADDIEVGLLPHQLEFLSREDDPLVIMCTGISAGKTYAASWYVAQQLQQQKRLIVSAQNYDALHRVIFGETMRRLDEIGISYTYNKTAKEIHVGSRGLAYGMTSENPSGILGLSNIDILVMDEAAYQVEEAYNWASDRLRGPEVTIPKKRLFSSPDSFNQVHAWFANLCAKYPNCVINASALDNYKNPKAFRDELLERYPPGSVLYEQQVLGHFIDSRLANAAIDDRCFMDSRPAHGHDMPVWVGADVAGQGRDDSLFVVIDEYGIVEIRRRHGSETQELVSEMLDINRMYRVAGAAVDVTGGFGSGLYDYTKRTVKNMLGINFASAPDEECFNNIRTQMHFDTREVITSSHFYCPLVDDGAKIREECRHVLYIIDNKGRTALIPKEDVRKSVSRSPDALDGLILAVRAKKASKGEVKGKVDAVSVAQRMLAAHR